MTYYEKLLESIDIDYKRLDNLVRSGLIKIVDYPIFKTAIKKVDNQSTNSLSARESKVLSAAMGKVLTLILDDDAAFHASLMNLRNGALKEDIEGIAFTTDELESIVEACSCLEKTKGEDLTKENNQKNKIIFKEGKWSNGTPVEPAQGVYSAHDDPSLTALHKVLSRPFKSGSGSVKNAEQLKELDGVEAELKKRQIPHTPYSDMTGIDESRLAMPLKGHGYHLKSDDELRYIQKDAKEAAEAMKDHSPKSEAKYLDQVNDASTILHYRSKGGKRVSPDESIEESVDLVYDIDSYSSYYNIGNVYLSDESLNTRMEQIKEAFESKDENFLIEGSFYGEIMNRIYSTRQQGHQIRDVSITSKGGTPHAEFTAVDKEGIVRKHTIHGNSHKVENRGKATKQTGKGIDNDRDNY